MDLEQQRTSISKELNQNEVDMCGVEFGIDDDLPEVLMGNGKIEIDSKGKTKICSDEKWQYQDKDASTNDPGKTSTSGPINSNNLNSSNSEHSCNDDNEHGFDGNGDDISNDDNHDGFLYENEDIDIQSRFDNVVFPPGVEAPFPLKDLAPYEGIKPTATTLSSVPDLSEDKRNSTILDLTESKGKSTISDLDENISKLASSSSPTDPEEVSSNEKEESGHMPKLHFKQFDTVVDFSDHHYSRMGFLGDQQPPKNWANSEQSCNNDDDNDISDDDNHDGFLYEDEDDYIDIQSQFENVDLLSGVEAPFPWMEDLDDDDDDDDISDYDDHDDFLYEDEDDHIDIQSQFDNVDLLPWAEVAFPWMEE